MSHDDDFYPEWCGRFRATIEMLLDDKYGLGRERCEQQARDALAIFEAEKAKRAGGAA